MDTTTKNNKPLLSPASTVLAQFMQSRQALRQSAEATTDIVTTAMQQQKTPYEVVTRRIENF